MTEPDTRTHRRREAQTDHGDDDAVAHIVMRSDQMKGYLSGEPIEALCGKVWVPTRDYQGLPICRRCSDERDRIVAGMNNLN